MEIIVAKHSGFCFGVQKAVDSAYKCVENRMNDVPIYTHGQIIHNRDVTDELESKGAKIIEDLSEAEPGSILIVRSHGETKQFYEDAKGKGIHLVDTTCPFVRRIHDLVAEAHKNGKDIIIVGDPNHPEVIGTNGWCDNTAYIFRDPEEAAVYHGSSALVVSQTTSRISTFQEVLDVLRASGAELEVMNTICSATEERQKSARELAKKMDAMIVIGGKNSSNTKKLYEICRSQCPKSFFVENNKELPLKEISKCNRIGIVAGASTPERIIKEVISTMSDNITKDNENVTMADLMEEIDASMRLPHNGEIVTGSVVDVNDSQAIINLNGKRDGILTAHEASLEGDQKLTDVFHKGDTVEAKVIKTDDNEGGILLSTKKLEVNKHWEEITEALENKTNIEVKVVRIVKGGVIAAYKEVSGFIPMSQLSNRYVESADEFLGQVLTVKVTRVDQKRNRAVFSHKAVLAEERQKKLDEIWETLKVGD
ncbi:MAG: 4-hydroxy-3-methylbut-2-enyl diphosphate reductase, partial [Eubacteriales bacterium]|nr:4-hydroxy-3-methylbut-2-enyl diphosphate reductase [Eubacteriales bacterium]